MDLHMFHNKKSWECLCKYLFLLQNMINKLHYV